MATPEPLPPWRLTCWSCGVTFDQVRRGRRRRVCVRLACTRKVINYRKKVIRGTAQ